MRTTAAGGPFVATIFPVDDNGDLAAEPVATTTVPMQVPLYLDAGEYKMRLAGQGRFSEAVRFSISPGEMHDLRYVDRRPPPNEIDIQDKWVATIGGSDDAEYLSTLDSSTLSIFGRGGQPLLEVRTRDIAGTDDAVDFGYQIDQEWTGNRNAIHPYFAKVSRLISDAVDLNGDGSDDFVISARNAPVIAAIGRNGKTLWKSRLQIPQRDDFPPISPLTRRRIPLGFPFVLQIIPIDDLNADGTADLVVNLVRINPDVGTEPYLVTISGKTGDEIATTTMPPIRASKPLTVWPTQGRLLFRSRKVDEQRQPHVLSHYDREHLRRNDYVWEHNVLWSTTSVESTLPVTPPLQLIELGDRKVAVTFTHDSINVWDLSTGQPVGESISLPFQMDSVPLAVHLGKGSPPAYFAWSSESVPAGNTVPRQAGLFVLGEPHPRWVTRREIRWDILANGQETSDLPLAADLDGDGVDELIVPQRDRQRANSDGQLDCLDITTGGSKWNRPVPIQGIELLPERAVVVRDVDGDDIRDLVVASLSGRRSGDEVWAQNSNAQEFAFFIDLISGADGTLLSWRRLPITLINSTNLTFDIDSIHYDPTSRASEVSASIVYGDGEDATLESMTVGIDLLSDAPPKIARDHTSQSERDADAARLLPTTFGS